MRYDRFLSMKNSICSLSMSTDVTIYMRPNNIHCDVSGRCSPLLSHQAVIFSEIPNDHRYYCDPKGHHFNGYNQVIVENSRPACLTLSPARPWTESTDTEQSKPAPGWEGFPREMFEKLFESIPFGKTPFEKCEIVWVFVENIRTRKEIEGLEKEEDEASTASIPDDLLITKSDAVQAGLCADGVDRWIESQVKQTPGERMDIRLLDLGNGKNFAVRAGELKKVEGNEDVNKLLHWFAEQCKSDEWVESHKEEAVIAAAGKENIA